MGRGGEEGGGRGRGGERGMDLLEVLVVAGSGAKWAEFGVGGEGGEEKEEEKEEEGEGGEGGEGGERELCHLRAQSLGIFGGGKVKKRRNKTRKAKRRKNQPKNEHMSEGRFFSFAGQKSKEKGFFDINGFLFESKGFSIY